MSGIPGVPGPDEIRPDIDAVLEVVYRFPTDETRLGPATIDAMEAEINQRLREQGVTREFTPLIQDIERELVEPGEEQDLNGVFLRFEKSTLSFRQVETTKDILVAVMDDFDFVADERAVFVSTRTIRTIGPDD